VIPLVPGQNYVQLSAETQCGPPAPSLNNAHNHCSLKINGLPNGGRNT
jgi:hypothetical protein